MSSAREDLREAVRRALLDELRIQNPDMREQEGRDTVWLSGGCTPQSAGTFISVPSLTDAILAALPQGEAEPTAWRHVANEWADMATSGLQWLRNIADGTSTVEDALANMSECLVRCEATRDPAHPTQPAHDRVSVKSARERAGLSLQQVADRAGMSKAHVWEIERGRAPNPTIRTIEVLARALSVSPISLFSALLATGGE